MSDSVRPHRRQPTRLLRPWDSPGKNTGVACHYLLQCMKVKSESESLSVLSNSLGPMDYTVHGIDCILYPGQNTRVRSLSLLQGIFPTQGWNPGLLHCRRILYGLSHQGNLLHMLYRFNFCACNWGSGTLCPKESKGRDSAQGVAGRRSKIVSGTLS